MLDRIREAWGWTGLHAEQVIDTNPFGNLNVRSSDGTIWRICPEELSCEQIARDAEGFNALARDPEFRVDWEMTLIVDQARQLLGLLPEGHCYCLKVPTVIGGGYDADNLGTITLDELIWFSGYVADQIKDVPDGGEIVFDIVR